MFASIPVNNINKKITSISSIKLKNINFKKSIKIKF